MLVAAPTLQACLFTITNDTDTSILLFNLAGDKGAIIHPGQQSQFGNPKKHARFVIAQETEENQFDTTRIVKQHACSATHGISLSISEAMSGQLSEDNAPLMTVTPFSQTKFATEAKEEANPSE